MRSEEERCTCDERECVQMLSFCDLDKRHFLFKVSDSTEGQDQPVSRQQCVQRRLQR